MRPCSMKSTRSARASGRAGRCSDTSTAQGRRSTRSKNASAASGSSCEVGSSSSSSLGRSASAEARQTRCSSPAESSETARSARCRAPTAASASSTRGQISADATPTFSRPNATSFATRLITAWSSGSWKTEATCPTSDAGADSRVSRPATITRPAKTPPWKCGTSPASARRSVDLPPPEGPSSAMCSPSSIVSEMPSSTGLPATYASAGRRSGLDEPCAHDDENRAGERQPVQPGPGGLRGPCVARAAVAARLHRLGEVEAALERAGQER